ncbi:MAG: hypothetical protein ACRDP5_27630 [Streptosporangiaceae bacterium]
MKKVRYVIGAAGALALTPALGTLTPAVANAAATGQSVARQSGKTVSPNQSSTSPAVSRCGFQSPVSSHTGQGANKFQGLAYASNPTGRCVDYTRGILYHSQTGLEMRTRLYRNGKQVYQGYVKGSANPLHTKFTSQPRRIADQACEALVYSTDIARVAFGPVCENIPG